MFDGVVKRAQWMADCLNDVLVNRRIKIAPPILLAYLYLLFALIGSGLLMLPAAQNNPISFSDALFTSVAALTVGGLTVIDLSSDLSFLGQAMVLALVQLGDLGLMTFATLVLVVLGLPVGINQKVFLRGDLGQTSFNELLSLVRIIAVVVLGCEAVGTLLLCFVTVPEAGFWLGLWQALFVAVTAFNNAGLTLYPDSLVRFATSPLMNLTVPLLSILGGIGFGVLWEVGAKRRFSVLSLHSKIMLVGTASLLLSGLVLVCALEWSNPKTLGALGSSWDKLMTGWFQAVTPRTAGFSTYDTAEQTTPTAMVSMLLMFIGGGATSTAGGIKVTTFAVLLMAVYAFFTRAPNMHAFGRDIGFSEALSAMTLVTLSAATVIVAVFLLGLVSDEGFLQLSFDTLSAFGTVGVSMGATEEQGFLGRLVLMSVMFIGRVGPLFLAFTLANPKTSRIRYPEKRIFLG